MNEVAEQQPGTTDASLGSFLDAADVWYARVNEALKSVGLSWAKYDLLEQLRQADEPVHLRLLAECQGCAASNITQLVDRLEAEGFVQRVDDPEDRRSVRAALTPAGRSLAEDGKTQLDLVRAQFAAAFTGADRAEFARLLGRIR